MDRLLSCLVVSALLASVECYPGALCNVTYDVPVPCSEVWAGLEKQMKEWDNTTGPRCPGECDQRHFLPTQRGPPLVPTQLEGSGETCTKCPCGQKCLYVHTYTDQTFLKGRTSLFTCQGVRALCLQAATSLPSSDMWTTSYLRSYRTDQLHVN